MTTRARRTVDEMGMSFLDVICCGFGAVILLLMITKVAQPLVLERSAVSLDGTVAARREALSEIRGQAEQLKRELSEKQQELNTTQVELAQLERELSHILGRFQTSKSDAEEQVLLEKKLSSAKQSLTEEMERLLGAGFQRSDNTIGGIAVDSEYVVFVIDTSGSMFNYAWNEVIKKLRETLAIYPALKGIQVMSDEGEFMFPQYGGQWIPDSPARRRAILERMRTFNPFSNSSPVEGIEKAVRTFQAPDKRISVYVFGDDFTGRSIEEVVDTVDRINAPDENGQRPVRINAVGFPTLYHAANPPDSLFRFAALMREITYRNNGTFVGLPEFQ
jgi:regulator of replication initiation timing